MAFIAKQRYKLDIAPRGGWVIVYASQHDDGAREIEFEITNQGKSFSIPASINVSVQGIKSNKSYFSHSCSYSGNIVTIALADDMTDVIGKAICVLKFTNSSQQKLATAKFVLNVDTDSSSEGIIIDTEAEEIFNQLLNDIRAQAASISADIAELQSMVGSPLVASTVSAMTDHNKIYVYTGSESGYTSGNWYYWNGSAWTSGGVYNAAAVETDKTLTIENVPADGRYAGGIKKATIESQVVDMKKFATSSRKYGWTTGYYNNSTGVATSSSNFLRSTEENIPLDKVESVKVTPPSGYAVAILAFKLNGTFDLYGQGNSLTHPENIDVPVSFNANGYSYYRISVGNFNDQSGNSKANSEEFCNSIIVEEFKALKSDKTLAIDGGYADALAVGNRFSEMEFSTVDKIDDIINNTISNKFERVVFDKTDALLSWKKVSGSGSTAEDENGIRLRVVFYIPVNNKIKIIARCNYGSGLVIASYDNISSAIAHSSSHKIQDLAADWTKDEVFGYLNTGGWITFSIKKSDDSVFTDEDKEEALSNLDIFIEYYDNNSVIQYRNNPEYEELYVGPLANAHLTASGLADDEYNDYRLSSEDEVAFPWGSIGGKFIIDINPQYKVAVRYGIHANGLSGTQYWLGNGDEVVVPNGYNYYRFSFCKDVGATGYTSEKISQDDIQKMHVRFHYKKSENLLFEDEDKLINAARLRFDNVEPNTLNDCIVIGHTSDCHGDIKRVKNFLDFCDHIGVDCACITGDIVAHNNTQGLVWFAGLVNDAKSLCAICTGNHDAYYSDFTDQNLYDYMFLPIAEKIGNATGKNWYYVDIPNKNLRVISIHLYELGGTTRNLTHFSNEQLAWLCSAMANTPQNYGIILLYHSPQVATNKTTGFDKFYQDVRKSNSTYNAVSGSPITDIVDAFISRTTINKSYNQTGSPSSVSVSADFSGVDESIEFIAHLTGHMHQDSIYHIANCVNMQLMLNVICTNSLYGGTSYPYLCDIADIPRRGVDATQNSFNVYIIDRVNKSVKIIRVGSNITHQMQKRDYMEILYSD